MDDGGSLVLEVARQTAVVIAVVVRQNETVGGIFGAMLQVVAAKGVDENSRAIGNLVAIGGGVHLLNESKLTSTAANVEPPWIEDRVIGTCSLRQDLLCGVRVFAVDVRTADFVGTDSDSQ